MSNNQTCTTAVNRPRIVMPIHAAFGFGVSACAQIDDVKVATRVPALEGATGALSWSPPTG